MLEKLQMYINGEWVDSHSSETIEVMNPSDDSVMGVITAGNSDDVDRAVASAKSAFSDFSFSTKEERVQILENIIAEYEKRAEELAETISKEMGAPIWLSQVAQVASGLSHFKDTLNVLKDYDFEFEKDDLAAATALSTSSELPAVITPMTESSDGFITSIVSVE